MTMKFHLKQFDLDHLRPIYEAALHHEKMVNQWLGMDDFQRAAQYAAKLEAIVELMESIVVFNHGDGLRNFGRCSLPMPEGHGLRWRLHSFDVLFHHRSSAASQK